MRHHYLSNYCIAFPMSSLFNTDFNIRYDSNTLQRKSFVFYDIAFFMQPIEAAIFVLNIIFD